MHFSVVWACVCEDWRLARPVVSQMSVSSVRVGWSLPGSVAEAVTEFRVQYRWVDKNQDSTSSHWHTAADSLSPTRTYYDVTQLRTGILQRTSYYVAHWRCYYTDGVELILIYLHIPVRKLNTK